MSARISGTEANKTSYSHRVDFIIRTNNMQLFCDYLFRKGSTCFGRFLRPSSGAHNCTFSFRYCQPVLLQAGIVGEIPEAECTVMCS